MSDYAPLPAAYPLPVLLEYYYFDVTDEVVHISDFTAIGDGWETEVYSFTLMQGDQVDHLVLRMYLGENAHLKAEREYEGMDMLRQQGYPVPHVFELEPDRDSLGKPFIIMQKIDGQPLVQAMFEDTSRQPELLSRLVQLFIDLHGLDYEPLLWLSPAILENNSSAFLRSKLAFANSLMIEQLHQFWVKPVLNWLETHMAEVSTSGLSVLHGDFNWSNVLLTPDNKAYVIDWSQVEVGDYRYDLAWTLLLTQPPEARDFTLREYERLSGHPIEQLEYFDVIACLRRLFDLSASLGSGAESLGMRPETVEIMRRQHDHYQQVYALLKQITGLTLPEIERLIDSLGST